MSPVQRHIQPLYTWRSSICESDLPSSVRLVALTLSLYMNERGGSAYPGALRLAKETGLSERTVRAHLAFLADKGWLKVVSKGGRKGGRSMANEYEATDPRNPATDTETLQLDAANPATTAPHVSKKTPSTKGARGSSGSQDPREGMVEARKREHERNAEAAAEPRPDITDADTSIEELRKIRAAHKARRRVTA